MLNYARKQARRVRKELNYSVTYEQLCHYARDNGFAVLYYSEAGNLIQKLKVEYKARKARAFIYCDDLIRFIFIEDSQTNKLHLLTHELGHYILGHGAKCTAKEEQEANLFAELVLKKRVSKLPIIALAVAMTAIAAYSVYLLLHNTTYPVITNIQQQ